MANHLENDRKHYINKFGEVFVNSNYKRGIIQPTIDGHGYNIIRFGDENGGFNVFLSHLMADAFFPENQLNLPTINH